MAIDMFLQIDTLKGESRDKAHAGDIDVLSYSWGVSNSGGIKAGGAGAGKASFQDLSIVKYQDAATTALFSAAASGKHFVKAVLINRKAGENPLEFFKVTLTDVLLTSLQTGASGGEDRITETVTLAYAKMEIEYKTLNDKGTVAATMKAGWNVSENVKV